MRPRHRAAERLRHPRSLRRDDEGRDAGDLSRRSRSSTSPTTVRRTTSLEGALQLAAACRYFPRRHHLPRGGRSRRRLGAPRHRRRSRRLSVRRARQRRADRGVPRDAAEADRRADRAAVRAADGEPHVRRTRSVRAGGRVAGQRHPAAALGRTVADLSTARHPRARGRRRRASDGVVLLVDRFGNLVTNIDRRTFETLRPRSARDRDRRRPARSRGVVAPTPTSAPAEICALFGSTDHLEMAANGGSAAAALALTRGAIVEVEAMSVTSDPVPGPGSSRDRVQGRGFRITEQLVRLGPTPNLYR